MISRYEIEQKGEEFGIHVANVQRDYVFGWLLVAIFDDTDLKNILIFKGGNCFRKAYFPNTQFSADLDFSTETAIDEALIVLLTSVFLPALKYLTDKRDTRWVNEASLRVNKSSLFADMAPENDGIASPALVKVTPMRQNCASA